VIVAVRLLDNWITAEVKIRVPRVAARPAAGVGGERADLFRGGQDRIDEGGCLRRRLTKKSRRLKSGAAVHPSRNRNGDLLDLLDGNHPSSEKAKHNTNPMWHSPSPGFPTPDLSRPHTEQLGDALLREAKHTERLAEFDRSRAA
jgi:hypothetical protein